VNAEKSLVHLKGLLMQAGCPATPMSSAGSVPNARPPGDAPRALLGGGKGLPLAMARAGKVLPDDAGA